MSKLNINSKNIHRLRDPATNPCLKESDLTIRCLEKHHYVKEECDLAFKNYNNCRTYWINIMKQRKLAKIKPDMPGEKERELIRAEHNKGRNVISAPVHDEGINANNFAV